LKGSRASYCGHSTIVHWRGRGSLGRAPG